MKYFKVYKNFTEYIPIDETELEKALYAFEYGKALVLENGAMGHVESIMPDFNRSLGWNSDYKPTPDDYGDIENEKTKYRGYIGEVKDKIHYLISEKKEHLIGKNVEIPELERKEIGTGSMKSIGELLDKDKK